LLGDADAVRNSSLVLEVVNRQKPRVLVVNVLVWKFLSVIYKK